MPSPAAAAARAAQPRPEARLAHPRSSDRRARQAFYDGLALRRRRAQIAARRALASGEPGRPGPR